MTFCLEMRIALSALLLLIATSCDRHPVLEGNTAGVVYWVEWITADSEPLTCFVVDGVKTEISRTESDDAPPRFDYAKLRFRCDGQDLIITDLAGKLLERLPIRDSVFILSAGTYSKVPQDPKIKTLMTSDHATMDDELILHLKASGKL